MSRKPYPIDVPCRARRILTVAAVILVLTFLMEARAPFAAVRNPHTANRPMGVGAFVRVVDGHGYYAWLRSPLIDGDWDFENEFDFYRAQHPEDETLRSRTRTGLAPNQWSVGPALVWSVAVVPVHLIVTACGWEQVAPAGYAPPYQLAVGAVTLALALVTLFFIYGLASRFAAPVPAAAAAAVTVLGTPLLAYGAVEVGMAHGPAAAALSGYLLVWVRTVGGTRPGRWFVLGLLLGIACLMRWQLVTFAVVPAAEVVWLVAGFGWREVPGRFVRMVTPAALGALLGFAPQMAAWWVVYGSPLHNPHPTQPDWLSPSFWRVLGSSDRGLFFWTPVTLLAVVGFAAVRSRGPWAGAGHALLIGAAVQIYLLAAVCDRGVSLGWSFGFRLLTEVCVVLGVGLAGGFDRVGSRRPTLVAVVFGGLVCWNFFLLGLYRHTILPPDGSGPAVLVRAVLRYIHWRPLEAVISVLMALTLARTLAAGFARSAPAAPETSAPVEPERKAA